jgi:hypothetical protein
VTPALIKLVDLIMEHGKYGTGRVARGCVERLVFVFSLHFSRAATKMERKLEEDVVAGVAWDIIYVDGLFTRSGSQRETASVNADGQPNVTGSWMSESIDRKRRPIVWKRIGWEARDVEIEYTIRISLACKRASESFPSTLTDRLTLSGIDSVKRLPSCDATVLQS